MAVNSPQLYLQVAGTNSTERGQHNRLQIVEWLFHWGFTSAPILQQLIGHQSSGHAATLAKSGWLRQTKTESGSPRYYYTLSEKGLELATKYAKVLYRYPEMDVYKVNQALIRHHILAQQATLNALQAGKITGYQTERMIDQEGDKLGEKKPDVVFMKDQLNIGVEIELSAKWDRKLDQFMMGIGHALATNRYQLFMIYSDSPAILERYQTALHKPLKHWVKDDRGHWHTQGEKLFPETKRSLVQFQLIKG